MTLWEIGYLFPESSILLGDSEEGGQNIELEQFTYETLSNLKMRCSVQDPFV